MRIQVGAVAVPMVIGVLALAACSGGGAGGAHGGSPSRSPTCTLVARLDNIANGAARIDISDPDASKRMFSAAVSQYVTTVRQLRSSAPPDLDASLDRVAADVEQYRFAAALTDRADLDSYAKQACHRTVVPVVLTEPSTVPLAAPTTTVTLPVTGTTVASATTESSTIAG